jgi:integrase
LKSTQQRKEERKMALKKRGNTYHADFVVDGQRYRQSLETSDWREAQSLHKELIARAKAGKASAKKHEIAKLTFRDAAERFLEDRLSHLTERSIQTERERSKPVNERLGNMAVSRITVAHVTSYIRERKAAGRANATVNRELDVIRGVLKKAKRWHMSADDIQPLPVRQTIGRAMSYEEKTRLLKVASVRPEWQNAAWAATLALNTTMRGVEIKNLRWRDVDFLRRTLTVRRSKTDAGLRSIPLNDDAWNTIQELRERALKFTDTPAPEHFLFPSCEHNAFDSIRPMKSWRTSWRKLTRLIQCPVCREMQNPAEICINKNCKASLNAIKSPLAGLRFHDLRHHAITELAESQTSDSTIMALAGHVSRKMLEHYTHIRQDAKREAVNVLSRKPPQRQGPGSYGTNHGTNRVPTELGPSYVIDSLVELSGIEPLTSSLRTRRSPS